MVVASRDNTTNYLHPQETNLLNVHKAMEYDSYGQPTLRTQNFQNAAASSAFGEPIAVPITPVIQADAIYGLLEKEFETFDFGDGEVNSTGTMFEAHSGTQPGSYGVVRTKSLLRYRPGQGAMARFTAGFTTPDPGTTQRAGMFAQEQAVNVGYDGTNFGILRQNGGKTVIYQLTVTAGAGGAETATVTLDGTVFTVSLTAGNAEQTATQLGNASYAGYTVEHCEDKVIFLKNLVGTESGAFSYTSTGTSTGTMAQLQAGVDHTDYWVYQSEWNIDKLDGTGPSGVVLDHSKLNIFQISFRWLGAGEIRFAIENPIDGNMIFFHHIHYSNRNTDVHLDNPSFKIGYIAANITGGTVSDVHVYGASLLAAVEGVTPSIGIPYAVTSGTKNSLNTAGTYYHILSIKNRLSFANKVNLRNLKLDSIGVAFDGNDPLEFLVFVDKIPNGNLQWQLVDSTNSSTLYSTTATTFPAGTVAAAAYVLPSGGSANFDIQDLNLLLPPNSYASIVARSGQGISSIIASATWSET